MWYETDETKPQTKEGVIDIQYMTKKRKKHLKMVKIILAEGMKGEDLGKKSRILQIVNILIKPIHLIL